MNAVVIVRGKIQRRRTATGESVRPFVAAEQGGDAVRQAFRLQRHAVLHRAVMGAAAIDWADNGSIIAIDRAGAVRQRAGEEIIERRVGKRILLGGKIGIGTGDFHIGADDGVFDQARFDPREAVHQRARQMAGNQGVKVNIHGDFFL